MPRGIDISEFNGNIDINEIINGVRPDFVIIRAGDGDYWDCYLYDYIAECIKAEIPYGLYWLIRDWSIASAERTAANLAAFADKQKVRPSVGIWCDVEGEYDADPSKAIPYVDAFCRTIEDSGYYAGIYCNQYYHNFLYPALSRFDCWIAFWDDDPNDDPGYGTMKQYSTSRGRLDLDVCFVPLETYQIKKDPELTLEERVKILEDKIKRLEELIKNDH